MDENAVKKLLGNITKESNRFTFLANSILSTFTSASRDKNIIEYYRKQNNNRLKEMKEKAHKIQEYMEEIDSHIYDGDIIK